MTNPRSDVTLVWHFCGPQTLGLPDLPTPGGPCSQCHVQFGGHSAPVQTPRVTQGQIRPSDLTPSSLGGSRCAKSPGKRAVERRQHTLRAEPVLPRLPPGRGGGWLSPRPLSPVPCHPVPCALARKPLCPTGVLLHAHGLGPSVRRVTLRSTGDTWSLVPQRLLEQTLEALL